MMITFITQQETTEEPDILTSNQSRSLIVTSLEGQQLALFLAPEEGWTHEKLCALNDTFPPQWHVCGAEAYLGDQWVGSTEV
jgi:5'-deoxynucleotidase